MVAGPDVNCVTQTLSCYLKATFIHSQGCNKCRTKQFWIQMLHWLQDTSPETAHNMPHDIAATRCAWWTAAVCCCLPALGRSMLPWVVWRAVSVYITTQKQKVSEHTQTLCSTLLLWTHTYLLQMLCNTKSDKRRITNRCGRYQLWLTWRYHPSKQTENKQLTQFDT